MPKSIIYQPGEIVGSYTVLGRDSSKIGKAQAIYYNIKCNYCQQEKSIRSSELKKKNICNCQKTDPMIGQIFFELEIIKKTDLRAKDKSIIYECKCIKCGNIQYVAGNVLRSGRQHCKECYQKRSTLIDMTGQTFGELTVLSRDKSFTDNEHKDLYWICKCNLCSSIKTIRGISLRKGITISCGCIKSKGELKISQILSKNNIKFMREYSFEDLRDQQKLRFDFAILNEDGSLSHLIEFDGIQHFLYKEEGWNNEENYKKNYPT